MSQYIPLRWELTVEFPPLSVQADDDPENEFPYDYVSLCVAFVSQEWGGLPEELPEFCEWDETNLKVTSDMLDPCIQLINFIGMHCIPEKLVLE